MIPTEAQEAKVFVAYLRLKGHRFMHIPSETGSSAEARRRAIRMKQQGTSRGFPDYLLIVKNQLAAVELKRIKGSKTTPEQLEWLTALRAAGVPGIVAKGAKEAIEFVEKLEVTH